MGSPLFAGLMCDHILSNFLIIDLMVLRGIFDLFFYSPELLESSWLLMVLEMG